VSNAPLVRVAFVKYSPQGKVYSARCERDDLVAGDMVEVLDSDNVYKTAEIVGIDHHRWSCKDRVANRADEVEYRIDDSDEGFCLARTVKGSRPSLRLVAARES
jgi:hypothetical protein